VVYLSGKLVGRHITVVNLSGRLVGRHILGYTSPLGEREAYTRVYLTLGEREPLRID